MLQRKNIEIKKIALAEVYQFDISSVNFNAKKSQKLTKNCKFPH